MSSENDWRGQSPLRNGKMVCCQIYILFTNIHITWSSYPDFVYHFMLNTMDSTKEDETVCLIDPTTQPLPEVYNLIMKRMGVDVSVQNVGYHLSDQKGSICTCINNVNDFSYAVETQHNIQSCAYKSKYLHIINKVCYFSYVVFLVLAYIFCYDAVPVPKHNDSKK